MAIVSFFLISLALAFGASGLLFLPLFLWHKKSTEGVAGWPQLLLPLALAVGFGAGALYVYRGWPAFPPIDSTHWIFWGIAPVLLLSALSILAPRWIWWRLGLRLGLGLGLFYLIALPLQGSSSGTLPGAGGACTGLAWLLWGSAQETRLRPPVWVSLINFGVVLAASVVLFLAGSSALLAQLAAIALVSLWPALAAGLLKIEVESNASLDLAFYLCAGLWSAALLYSSLTSWAALILVALALPALGQIALPRSFQGQRGGALVLVLSLIWVVLGLFWAYPAGPELYYG